MFTILKKSYFLFRYIYKWFFSFQNNYIFMWGNSWMKDLLVDPNTRPYGFPPALWIALQKGATVVPAYEREDPLCRWMFMSCTPDHTLSIQRVPGANGTSDWCIGNLTAGYLESVRQPRNVRESPTAPVRSEVTQRLVDYDYYRKLEARNKEVAEKKRKERIESEKEEKI